MRLPPDGSGRKKYIDVPDTLKRLLAEGIWLMQVLAPRVAHSGATRAVRHRPRRRARRTHPAHDLGLRPRAGQRHHRDAGHRRLDTQNMLAGCGRCLRRFRRPAGTPLGIREDAARRAPQAALPLRGGRRGHRPGLPPGQMAPRARRRGRCHHRCQDPRHAHLHRRHACRGRKPLHRHRRRFRKGSRGSSRKSSRSWSKNRAGITTNVSPSGPWS